MSSRPHRHRRQRSAKKTKTAPLPKGLFNVRIDEVGAKGDGRGTDENNQPFYVPYSCAGDLVEVKCTDRRADALVGEIVNILEPGGERTEAPCPHYTKCGGCSLQHLSPTAYGDWKKTRIIEVISRAGLNYEPEDPVLIPAGQRRRASFAVMKKGKKIVFGFNARNSHRIEEISDCLLLTPELKSLIAPLRELMSKVMKQEGRGDIIINHPGEAPDIVFALPGRVELSAHEALVSFAHQYKIGRISWQEDAKGTPETVMEVRPVTTSFSDVPVPLPPAPFLQPSKSGEEALVEIALSGLQGEKKILDLYAGCGSFTFALAKHAIVHAVESHEPAIKALERAAGRANMGGRITTEVRDLSRQPLMGKELAKFDAILFDPPRSGAKEQAEAIADCPVKTVIAISCNPATFGRDIAQLIEGGYQLKRLVPVDQFTWSAHIEVAAILEKTN